jgi:hypothetical protein
MTDLTGSFFSVKIAVFQIREYFVHIWISKFLNPNLRIRIQEANYVFTDRDFPLPWWLLQKYVAK